MIYIINGFKRQFIFLAGITLDKTLKLNSPVRYHMVSVPNHS